NKARTAERNTRYYEAQRSAETEYKHYKKDPQFLAGLVVYMCNGDLHDGKPIRLSTSNEVVHSMFLHFMESYLGIEKSSVHFWLLLSAGAQENKVMNVWSKRPKITSVQFYKTQYIQQKTNGKAL